MGPSLQVSEAEEEEQMQVDNIKQQETQLATAKKAAGLARWRRLQVSITPLCTFVYFVSACLVVCLSVRLSVTRQAVSGGITRKPEAYAMHPDL